MSGSYNYNYGDYYNSSQHAQQHPPQSTASSSYAPPSTYAYATSSSASRPIPSQIPNGTGQDLARYQYTQHGTQATGTSTASNWPPVSRSNGTTSEHGSEMRYGEPSARGANTTSYGTASSYHGQSIGYNSYSSSNAYAQGPQSSYGSHAHNTYGQQQARPDSVSSAGSTLAPPASVPQTSQSASISQQREIPGIRNVVQSPFQAQPPPRKDYPYQQTHSSGQHSNAQTLHHRTQDSQVLQPHVNAQPSPKVTTAAASTAPTTVDPSQVYDRSAEIQREAAKAEIARRAEEQRVKAAEDERQHASEERRRREEQEKSRNIAEARKLSQNGAQNTSKPKKKRPRKSNTEKTVSNDPAVNAAAMTLMRTANANSTESTPGDLQAEMKAMFAKMREFNTQNPEMLSKMWQQERESYLAEQKTPQDSDVVPKSPPAVAPEQPKPKKKRTPKKDRAPTPNTDHQGEQSSSSRAYPNSVGPMKQAEKPNIGKTIWPEKRKAQLAQAASSLIEKMPENTGRSIQADEIARILDGNPSYVELCNEIESRGFKLNKSHFAKALLTAVPEVNRPKSSATIRPHSLSQPVPFTPLNGTSPVVTTTQKQPQEQASVIGDAEKRLMDGESLIGKSSNGGRPRKSGDTPDKRTIITDDSSAAITHKDPQLEGLDAVKHFNDRLPATKVFSPTTESKKNRKNRPSITPAPALPQTKEDIARKRTFADLVDLTQFSEDEGESSAKRTQWNGGTPVSTPAEPPAQPTSHGQPPPQAPVVPAMGAAHQQHQHQQQQPQGPLQPFAQSGHLLNYPRPTLLPPTQPTTQSKPGVAIPRDHQIHNIVVGEKMAKSRVARRSKYRSKTIARDVLLACGRHPDMRHLNAHLDIIKNLKLKDDVDLSTIRWDVIDPGGALPGAGVSTEPLPEDDLDMADDESSDNESVTGPRAVQSIPIGGGAATAVAVESARSAAQPLRIKQYQARKSDPGVRQQTNSTPIKPPSTAAPASAPKTGGGYSALRAAGEPKKKGRPVGWRKWMQKDQSDFSARSSTTGGSRKGRPPGATSKPPPKPPSPEFPAFKCEWEGCGAELHNLATLRRHLHKVHGSQGHQWICRWQGCGKPTAVKDGPRTVSKFERRIFSEKQEWEAHLEDDHLVQIKWAQGDGPAAGLSDNNAELSDAVLSDREGRQVTPRLSMPESPAEAVKRAEEARSRGSQGPAPAGSGNRRRTPLEEAQMELYSVEEKRRRLGVGIDKGGSTMVTDKRRRGFVEDGDIEMVDDE